MQNFRLFCTVGREVHRKSTPHLTEPERNIRLTVPTVRNSRTDTSFHRRITIVMFLSEPVKCKPQAVAGYCLSSKSKNRC